VLEAVFLEDVALEVVVALCLLDELSRPNVESVGGSSCLFLLVHKSSLALDSSRDDLSSIITLRLPFLLDGGTVIVDAVGLGDAPLNTLRNGSPLLRLSCLCSASSLSPSSTLLRNSRLAGFLSLAKPPNLSFKDFLRAKTNVIPL
jgi:hypothetical protein